MIQGRSQITKEDILEKVSEEELFHQYCDNFRYINVSFKSELRKDDNPSCRIVDLGKGLRYKDFGSTYPAMDIWQYIMQKYNLSFPQALEKVEEDLKHIFVQRPNNSSTTSSTKLKQRARILIRQREWLQYDKEYWFNRYGITKDILISYNVKPLSYYWLNGIIYSVPKHSYCYDYYWNNGVFLRKIYQPYDNKNKWISNVDTTIVQGIENISKIAPRIIISSSLKDVMCFKLLGYPAVAPNNERSWIPDIVWNKFKTRYKEQIIFFDNDSTGLESAKQFSEQYNTKMQFIPLSFTRENKNISDFIENHSLEEAKLLVDNLFSNL